MHAVPTDDALTVYIWQAITRTSSLKPNSTPTLGRAADVRWCLNIGTCNISKPRAEYDILSLATPGAGSVAI
ncbi:hypothetical protein B0T21DRAFT_291918 [Apiosordaria backusii]|uniref:Uncharacterized protein n=1 Tax=Apiosordaria backusii TaxID=314023 RepID=A0AA40B8A1_9PEZI|nr:hypothetical protein B0T21DRAFT_291918 [Apiosordaria backusii]